MTDAQLVGSGWRYSPWWVIDRWLVIDENGLIHPSIDLFKRSFFSRSSHRWRAKDWCVSLGHTHTHSAFHTGTANKFLYDCLSFRSIMNPPRPSKDKESPGASASSQVTFVKRNLDLSSLVTRLVSSRLESSRSARKNNVVVASEPKWYVSASDCFSACDQSSVKWREEGQSRRFPEHRLASSTATADRARFFRDGKASLSSLSSVFPLYFLLTSSAHVCKYLLHECDVRVLNEK